MFWEGDQLSSSAVEALQRLTHAWGDRQVEPEHALLVMLGDDQSPLVELFVRQCTAFHSARLRSLLDDICRHEAGEMARTALRLSVQCSEALRTAQADREWSHAGVDRRNEILCGALIDALTPTGRLRLERFAIPLDSLREILLLLAMRAHELLRRMYLGAGKSRPATLPFDTETVTPRHVGPIRGAPSSVPTAALPSPTSQLVPEATPGQAASSASAEIQCTAYAPPAVKRGESFLLQLFAHEPHFETQARRLARQFDPAAAQRGFANLSESIRQGQVLRFDLKVTGGTADLESASLKWTGKPSSVQFLVTVGTSETLSAIFARVTISLNSVPIGQVALKVAVSAQASAAPAEPLATSETFHRFFISYASKDREKVMPRVQMLERMGKEFRQDLLHLDPGVRYEPKLYDFIRECDAVLLFWSTNAKASEWVMRECRYCIETKGIARLLPVIIERPPPSPPPELAELHMNDKMLYFMRDP